MFVGLANILSDSGMWDTGNRSRKWHYIHETKSVMPNTVDSERFPHVMLKYILVFLLSLNLD